MCQMQFQQSLAIGVTGIGGATSARAAGPDHRYQDSHSDYNRRISSNSPPQRTAAISISTTVQICEWKTNMRVAVIAGSTTVRDINCDEPRERQQQCPNWPHDHTSIITQRMARADESLWSVSGNANCQPRAHKVQ